MTTMLVYNTACTMCHLFLIKKKKKTSETSDMSTRNNTFK